MGSFQGQKAFLSCSMDTLRGNLPFFTETCCSLRSSYLSPMCWICLNSSSSMAGTIDVLQLKNTNSSCVQLFFFYTNAQFQHIKCLKISLILPGLSLIHNLSLENYVGQFVSLCQFWLFYFLFFPHLRRSASLEPVCMLSQTFILSCNQRLFFCKFYCFLNQLFLFLYSSTIIYILI